MRILPIGTMHYSRQIDRLLRTYDAVLRSCTKVWLPFRKAVCSVQLTEEERFLVRLGSSDFQVIEEVLRRNEYDKLFAEPIGTIRNIVDLGANIGCTLRLWQKHYPGATVVAVEPDPENLRLCQKNTAHWRGKDCVFHFIQACAAGHSGLVSLDLSRAEWAYSMHCQTADAGLSVPALTVPQILEAGEMHSEIDLMKCDIEGAERDIFNNCKDWIGRIRNLAVELHSPYSRKDFCEDLTRNSAPFSSISTLSTGDGFDVVLLRRAQ